MSTRVKAAGDNITTFMCLNLLEPKGPIQACTGIALPLLNRWNTTENSISHDKNNLALPGHECTSARNILNGMH
jgi:hypothetical protein